MKICHAHCPDGGGGGLLAVVVAAAVAVALAAAFIVAHALILVLGAAGVLAVTAAGIWALHRYATIAYSAVPLRAPRKAVEAAPLPAFAELAGKQPAAISARPPVIQATVVSSTTVNARTGRTRQWPPPSS